MNKLFSLLASALCVTPLLAQDATQSIAQDDAADLAKKLANPVASLISVPAQANWDGGIGPEGDGNVLRINVQPVIPFSINEDWNLISRTILPVIHQEDVPIEAADDEFGLGDTLQSFFFSPKEPVGGWILGGGPALLIPTATDPALGAEKWGAGPTLVALRQQGPWTYGFLTNHIASFAGDDDRVGINATFLQPFVSYITTKKTTIGLNLETTYDWNNDQWSVPLNFTVNQLLKIGNQPVQIGAGVRYWLESAAQGPEGWGFRFQVTLLFPK